MVFNKMIRFEDDPIEDEVIFAVVPIDAFTGRIVRSNISVSISVESEAAESTLLQLPDKPIRSLSGLLVFIKKKKDLENGDSVLPDLPKYQIHLKAGAAGYFDPDPVNFTPRDEDNNSESRNHRRLDIPLFRRPEFSFPEEAILLSGVVVRGTDEVEGARISVSVPPSSMRLGSRNAVFETRSNERGAFTLAVRLPDADSVGNDSAEDESGDGVSVKFRIETRGADGEWEFGLEWTLKVIENKRNVFKSLIDLNKPEEPVMIMT